MIRLDNHTKCPACKNVTLPPSCGGNAITCVNLNCLAIIETETDKIMGRIEDGVAVYEVNRLHPAVELVTNPGSPGVYIRYKELSNIKSYLESLITISKNNKSLIITIQTLIEEIEKR